MLKKTVLLCGGGFFYIYTVWMRETGKITESNSAGNTVQSESPYIDIDLKANEDYNFFFVCPIMGNPYWKKLIEGIADTDACRKGCVFQYRIFQQGVQEKNRIYSE